MQINNAVRLLFVLVLSIGIALSGVVHAQAPKNLPNPSQRDPEQERMRLRNEGVAHFEAGITLKDGLTAFEAALALAPTSAVEHFNVGIMQKRLGDKAKARHHLLRAMQLDPSLANAHYVLGTMYKDEGKMAEARDHFMQAKQRAPTDPSPYYQLAMVARYDKDDERFLQHIVDALQLDPFDTGALYQLYQYYSAQGEKERAKEVFDEFSRLKRAASTSRKENQEDPSRLALPIRGQIDMADNARAAGFKPALRLETVPAGTLGPVAAFDVRDVDGDDLSDLIVVTRTGQLAVLKNSGQRRFGAPSIVSTAAPRDAAWLLAEKLSAKEGFRVLLGGRSGAVLSSVPLPAPNLGWTPLTRSAAPAPLVLDLDHDGDLDLAGPGFAAPLVNQGDASLAPGASLLNEAAVREALSQAAFLLVSDLGNLNGTDILACTSAGTCQLLRDKRGGLFEVVPKPPAPIPGLRWIGKADLNNDGLIDLVSLGRQGLIIDFNAGQYAFQRVVLGQNAGEGAVLADYNNDGLIDLVVMPPGQAPVLWLNQGRRRFTAAPLGQAPLAALAGAPLAHDLDLDGQVDLLALDTDGTLRVGYNTSVGGGTAVRINPVGVRSAPSGLFAQFEGRRGDWYVKYESDGRPLHIGIGAASYVEILRVTWPNGFVENKFHFASNQAARNRQWTLQESERISGSCPTIFAWNGTRFGFVTDAFISGPMGVPMGPGRYFPVDHDEYIKISADELVAQDGAYEIRITEELREVVYLDRLALLAVDHPSTVQVYPNEYLAPGPFPDFGIHGTATSAPPPAAVDQTGADVRALIAAVDNTYPSNFGRSIFTGFADTPQGVYVTLPEGAAESDHLRLFLTGWFYYFDSTSLIAAGQHPEQQIIWPQVQVERDGAWETVAIVGIPPGKNKTLVADLSGKLPPGTERVRVWTNIELYWDRILVDTGVPRNDAHALYPVPLREARVRFHGLSYPLEAHHGPHMERFDYHRVGFTTLWNPLEGTYTRYGDVLPLLDEEDSAFVVFGTGDEVALRFDASALPALPEGWSRDFLLHLTGYVKDGDKYTAHAGQVEPMPYKGMTAYPYDPRTEGPPREDASYQEYLRTYQTRRPLRFVGPSLAEPAPASSSASALPR